VDVGQVAVEEVGDDARFTGSEDFLGPRPRAILNSRSALSSASMMNPRSAPLTSIAESSTNDSTSSSTRPEPRARRPSRSAAICRRSPMAVVVARSTGGCVSASRNTISAPPVRPRRTLSPCASTRSVTCSPFT
jgi:hypothetical protein